MKFYEPVDIFMEEDLKDKDASNNSVKYTILYRIMKKIIFITINNLFKIKGFIRRKQ